MQGCGEKAIMQGGHVPKMEHVRFAYSAEYSRNFPPFLTPNDYGENFVNIALSTLI